MFKSNYYFDKQYNDFLNKHYSYKKTDELEILNQIYSNNETSEFTSIITILKSVRFKNKSELSTVVIEGKIYLKVNVLYFQNVETNEINLLKKHLKEEIQSNKILITSEAIPEEEFNRLRVITLGGLT